MKTIPFETGQGPEGRKAGGPEGWRAGRTRGPVISRENFRRVPMNGEGYFTMMSLHFNNSNAKKRGIAKNVLSVPRGSRYGCWRLQRVSVEEEIGWTQTRQFCGRNHRKHKPCLFLKAPHHCGAQAMFQGRRVLIPEAPWFKKSGKSDQSCHHETWIHLPTRAGSNAVVGFPHATAVIGNLWPANEEALATGTHLRCTSSSTGERMSLPYVKCVLMVPRPCVFLVLASFFTRVIHAICLHPAFPNLCHEKMEQVDLGEPTSLLDYVYLACNQIWSNQNCRVAFQFVS